MVIATEAQQSSGTQAMTAPDGFLVSGKVSHRGIIMGKKATYVILSRKVSGHDRSRGWGSSSSSPGACKFSVRNVRNSPDFFLVSGRVSQRGKTMGRRTK